MPRLSCRPPHRVRFTLNGRAVSRIAEPRMLLTDFLRHVLGATGTHVGCEHGVCGACTVEIDGVAGARLPDARRAGGGRAIRTVEASPAPAPLRRCRMLSAAITRLQCGFCTPAS